MITPDRLLQIESSWAGHIDDVHHMIAHIRRPAFNRAVEAIMESDPKELDLLKRLCESLLFDPSMFQEIKKNEDL
jgi:hypothetical protein